MADDTVPDVVPDDVIPDDTQPDIAPDLTERGPPNKYTLLTNAIYSLFGLPAWKTRQVATFPSNYVNTQNLTEFIRINVVSGSYGINMLSVSGQIIVDIFTEVNKGPSRANIIADLLDDEFVGKTIKTENGTVQLFNSAMTHLGNDRDNKALFRSSYTIPFNFNGVY